MSSPTEAMVRSAQVPRLLLGLLLAFAAYVHLTVVSRTVVDHPLRSDAGEYFSYAFNLDKFGVFSWEKTWSTPVDTAPKPDKVRSPGYPLFLWAVGNPEPTTSYIRKVTYFQAGLGVLSVLLTYLIAARVVGRNWALLAGLLTAASPHIVMTSTYLLTESLFQFLLLSSVLATVRAVGSSRRSAWVLAGCLWGACTLVRPTAQLLPLGLVLVALAVPALRRQAKLAALLLACSLAVTAPWIARNMSLQQSGPSLLVNSISHGSYPNFMYENNPESYGFPYRFDPSHAENSRNLPAVLRHIGTKFADEPSRYLGWYLIGKPYYFLSLENAQSFDILIFPTSANPYFEGPTFGIMRVATIALHWPATILSMAAAVLLAWRIRASNGQVSPSNLAAGIVVLVIVYAVAVHMVFAPFPRYAIPFRPLIFILAVSALHDGWNAVRRLDLPGRLKIRRPG